MLERPESSELGNCTELVSALTLSGQLRSGWGLFSHSRPDFKKNVGVTGANLPGGMWFETHDREG